MEDIRNKEIVTLIIESGASKTEWALKSGDGLQRFRTEGINVAVMSPKRVAEVVAGAADWIGECCGKISQIRFYGAGLTDGSRIVTLNKIFKTVFPDAEIAYGSDLLAAAQAAFRNEQGIVAILGTGSNSAFYDGHKIIKNVFPGGFILGDEGGGVTLGRMFVSDYIKKLVPGPLAHAFEEHLLPRQDSEDYSLVIDPEIRRSQCYSEIVENVYSGSNPAQYLASMVPFILENRDYEYVRTVIRQNFMSFVTRSLTQYDLARYPVAVVGSFGYACREDLLAIGDEYGINFSKFVASPIEELIK